jgi:hypothetical protein
MEKEQNQLVPAGTPNDGLPETWHPVAEPPIRVGDPGPWSAPLAGPRGPDQFFAASIPTAMQLQPDMVPTRYSGGLGAYRVIPPVPSADPGLNAAIENILGRAKK